MIALTASPSASMEITCSVRSLGRFVVAVDLSARPIAVQVYETLERPLVELTVSPYIFAQIRRLRRRKSDMLDEAGNAVPWGTTPTWPDTSKIDARIRRYQTGWSDAVNAALVAGGLSPLTTSEHNQLMALHECLGRYR